MLLQLKRRVAHYVIVAAWEVLGGGSVHCLTKHRVGKDSLIVIVNTPLSARKKTKQYVNFLFASHTASQIGRVRMVMVEVIVLTVIRGRYGNVAAIDRTYNSLKLCHVTKLFFHISRLWLSWPSDDCFGQTTQEIDHVLYNDTYDGPVKYQSVLRCHAVCFDYLGTTK